MSAWMVTDVHISALVQEAMVRGLCQPEDMDDLWQSMKFSNMYALHCRYDDPMPVDDPKDLPLARSTVETPLDSACVAKQINCWTYQCAEYDGYDQIGCAVLMRELQQLILIDLDVEDIYDIPRVNDLPWGIESWGDVMDKSSWGSDPRKGSMIR